MTECIRIGFVNVANARERALLTSCVLAVSSIESGGTDYII